MTKSDEMLVRLGMLNEDASLGEITMDTLGSCYAEDAFDSFRPDGHTLPAS